MTLRASPRAHAIAFAVLVLACRSRGGTAGPAETSVETLDATSRPDASPRVTAAGESFSVHAWAFDVGSTSFEIVDLSMHNSLTFALGPTGRVAVNGGFFDPAGRPLGLAVSAGKVLSKFSPTMSGGVFYTVDGVAHIAATEELDPQVHVDFAIQCRPRLVVQGHANVRSDDGQRAERTALCVREGGRSVDVVIAEPSPGTRGPSLFALGQYLAEQRHCEEALNLDGGPSTGVAYREGTAGAGTEISPRGPLRYAVVMR